MARRKMMGNLRCFSEVLLFAGKTADFFGHRSLFRSQQAVAVKSHHLYNAWTKGLSGLLSEHKGAQAHIYNERPIPQSGTGEKEKYSLFHAWSLGFILIGQDSRSRADPYPSHTLPPSKLPGPIIDYNQSIEDVKEQEFSDAAVENQVGNDEEQKELDQNSENPMPSPEQEEEIIKKKYGGMLSKKKPLISKDHERAFFDSADWALGKQGAQKPKGPLESLRPKLQPTPQHQMRSRRSAYAPADDDNAEDGSKHAYPEEENCESRGGDDKTSGPDVQTCNGGDDEKSAPDVQTCNA
ncbi:hypothetical protein SADUNF_Sadunf10G0126100 [Salix dunnii]|uniref:cAMP-regulated phosphoprotein 19-related protein n=1 Tax=Salix dunnii TaxID=1413687 RepID=A0A835JR41_9ROSI|nr:hypothetical protein SADUNF_Sadunf10G0126100 [Salix dunnii]